MGPAQYVRLVKTSVLSYSGGVSRRCGSAPEPAQARFPSRAQAAHAIGVARDRSTRERSRATDAISPANAAFLRMFWKPTLRTSFSYNAVHHFDAEVLLRPAAICATQVPLHLV